MLRLIEVVRRFLRAMLFTAALTLLAVTVWTFLWPQRDASDIAQADAIICLGAGMAPDGTLDPASITRVARCVELYEAGIAPLVVFSGGTAAQDGPSAGQRMAETAVAMLLPPEAALVEGEAQSTLQNALFSLSMVPGSARIVLVTEAFHLPRSWASFKWAGADDIGLVASEPIRRDDGRAAWGMILREGAAIWFNAGRVISYTIAGWIGLPEDQRVAYLR